MATYTANYDLIKPDSEDYYNIEDFNQNADILDEELKKREDHEADTNNPHQVTAAQVGAAEADHEHSSWDSMPQSPLPISQGGTGKIGFGDSKLTNAYRGISFETETPTYVTTGCIVGVYS